MQDARTHTDRHPDAWGNKKEHTKRFNPSIQRTQREREEVHAHRYTQAFIHTHTLSLSRFFSLENLRQGKPECEFPCASQRRTGGRQAVASSAPYPGRKECKRLLRLASRQASTGRQTVEFTGCASEGRRAREREEYHAGS